MALDSSGNIAVDFVWGNTPLQPDTGRGNEAVVTYTIAEADEKDGAQRFSFVTTSAPEVGTEFSVTENPAFSISGYSLNGSLNGTYTVLATESHPAGWTYVKTTSAYKTTVYGSATIFVGTASVDPADNFGGGEGDYGWSTTTKKKSAVLDPALDGHNITTEFWNNFPGYTPNAGFVPQQVFKITVVGSYGLQIAQDEYQDNPYDSVRHGYILNMYPNAMTSEKNVELRDLIISGALAGERIPETTFTDAYGNTQVLPEGWIVGADYSPGAYAGDYSFTIQVATAPNAFTNYTYVTVGTEIVIGVGAPKEVIFQGVNGTDFSVLTIQGGKYYGDDARFDVIGITPEAGSRLVELVNSGEINGAWVGLGITDESGVYNSGDTYYNKRNLIKVTSAQVWPDGYGNNNVSLRMDAYGWDSNFPYMLYQYNDGDTFVVIK